MASVDLGNGPVEFEATFGALLVYEEEFDGRDLISDLVPVDGKVPFTNAIRALWACIKAKDPSTPSCREWAAGITGVNTPMLLTAVIPAVNDGLFRSGPSEA